MNIYSNLSEWYKKIGYVPQSVYLTDDSIRKNIAFGLIDNHIDDDLVVKAVEKANLNEFINTYGDCPSYTLKRFQVSSAANNVTSLVGLEGLIEVTEQISIVGANGLTNLNGLENLTAVGSNSNTSIDYRKLQI